MGDFYITFAFGPDYKYGAIVELNAGKHAEETRIFRKISAEGKIRILYEGKNDIEAVRSLMPFRVERGFFRREISDKIN